MRIRPTRTVETSDVCPSCGEAIRHREIGYASKAEEPLMWLVASRFCSVGCVLDEHKPSD